MTFVHARDHFSRRYASCDEEFHKEYMIEVYNEIGLKYWAEDSGNSEQEEAEAWMLWFMVNE